MAPVGMENTYKQCYKNGDGVNTNKLVRIFRELHIHTVTEIKRNRIRWVCHVQWMMEPQKRWVKDVERPALPGVR